MKELLGEAIADTRKACSLAVLLSCADRGTEAKTLLETVRQLNDERNASILSVTLAACGDFEAATEIAASVDQPYVQFILAELEVNAGRISDAIMRADGISDQTQREQAFRAIVQRLTDVGKLDLATELAQSRFAEDSVFKDDSLVSLCTAVAAQCRFSDALALARQASERKRSRCFAAVAFWQWRTGVDYSNALQETCEAARSAGPFPWLFHDFVKEGYLPDEAIAAAPRFISPQHAYPVTEWLYALAKCRTSSAFVDFLTYCFAAPQTARLCLGPVVCLFPDQLEEVLSVIKH